MESLGMGREHFLVSLGSLLWLVWRAPKIFTATELLSNNSLNSTIGAIFSVQPQGPYFDFKNALKLHFGFAKMLVQLAAQHFRAFLKSKYGP